MTRYGIMALYLCRKKTMRKTEERQPQDCDPDSFDAFVKRFIGLLHKLAFAMSITLLITIPARFISPDFAGGWWKLFDLTIFVASLFLVRWLDSRNMIKY